MTSLLTPLEIEARNTKYRKSDVSVKVASNLFELIAIICAYSVLIFDGQRALNAVTLYKCG